MKKIFRNYFLATTVGIVFFGGAHAQSLKIQKEPILNSPFKEVAVDDSPANDVAKNSLSIADVKSKALKDFAQSFKEIPGVAWFRSVDGGYVAKFKKEGVETRVNYDSKGWHTSTISSYKEDKLPKDVRHIVKSKYYDYSIFWVDEVTVDNKTAYLVKIEDAKTFMTIRVIDGEMDVYESFIKG